MQPGAFERTMSPKAATLFCWWMWKPCKVNWTNPTSFWTGEAANSPESAAVASTLKHKHALVQWMLLSISWSSGMDVWLLALSYDTWTSTTSKCSQPWWSTRRRSMIALVVKQKMDEMKTKLKWISSETQLADGVTKIAARQLLADRLRSYVFSLHSDQSFQAAKKKTLAERQASARRNAIGRLQKGIGFAVLTNQLEPVRGDDFAEDSFSSYNIIFIFTCLTMFAATVFLAWQCLERMTRSLPRPMAVPRFQTSRMLGSLMRPFAFLWNQQAALEDVSTQNESGRDQTIHLLNCRVQMLQQQVNDKDERIQDLDSLVHYYEQDVTSTSLFVSRTGARYHLHRDCRALLQANQAGIRDLKCCSQCIQTLRDNSNLGGPWWTFLSSPPVWVWCHQTDPVTTLPGWNHHMQPQNHIGRSRRGLFGFYVSCLWTTIPEGPLLSLAIEATHDKTDSTPALHFVFALRAA